MAPTAQKPLVGDFAWPAFNPPQNSSRPSHHSHSHYESPFQQIDLRPSVLQSATDFLTQQLAAINAYLSRQPPLLIVLAVACIISLLGLTVFLCAARSCLEKQQRLHECRHHFSDDGGGDDGGRLALVAGEKGGHAPRPRCRWFPG